MLGRIADSRISRLVELLQKIELPILLWKRLVEAFNRDDCIAICGRGKLFSQYFESVERSVEIRLIPEPLASRTDPPGVSA